MDQKSTYKIGGMTCAACVRAVEKAVKNIEGVTLAQVNFADETLTVTYEEGKFNAENLARAVKKAGYKASPVKSRDEISAETELYIKTLKYRLIRLAGLTVPLFVVSMLPMILMALGVHVPQVLDHEKNALPLAQLQFVLCTLAVMSGGLDYFIIGYRNLFKRMPNMDSLIAVGTSASYIYSIYGYFMIVFRHSHADLYFESTAVILTLVTLGKYMEAISKGRTSSAIKKLTELAPETAEIEVDGKVAEIKTAQLKNGDIVIIKAGGRFPADGIISEGSTSADESMLTGESLPVYKQIGDEVICGSFNIDGFVKYKVTRTGGETMLSKIINLVEEAGRQKAPIAKLADVIAGYFVPVVMALSLLVFIGWFVFGKGVSFALNCAVSILVIACPCALGLATPAAIMVGTGLGAKFGVLFKNGESIETMSKTTVVMYDKTGTVTNGKLSISDYKIFGSMGKEKFFALIAAAEHQSSHPAAAAVTQYVNGFETEQYEAEDFINHSGYGIEATITGKPLFAGSRKFMELKGIPISDNSDTNTGSTEIYAAYDGELIGIIYVGDTVKESSENAVKRFDLLHIKQYMLTGDNIYAARKIASAAKIREENIFAGLLPEQKAEIIKEKQKAGEVVVMAGDGINDAPSLTLANTGIAVGSGADIAIESADIVLPKNDLNGICDAYILSKKIMRTIKQNLFFAFIYNIICIPAAAGILTLFGGPALNPMLGALAMSFSSVSVLLNSLSLGRYRIKP